MPRSSTLAERVLAGTALPSPSPRFLCTRPPLQCFPSEGPHLLAPALQTLLADVLSGRETGLVVAAALGAFARVLLHNGGAFLQARPCAAGVPAGN